MILGITGPRPNKIGGYSLPNPLYKKVSQDTENKLKLIGPSKLITGMAQGYDQYTAAICLKLGIPYIAAVPFEGQEYTWNDKDQRIYRKLLSKAESVVVVSHGFCTNEKYLIRNRYIVDSSDQMLACYYPGQGGGTEHCVNYAKLKGKLISYVDSRL